MRNLNRAFLAGSLSLAVGVLAGCGGNSAGLLTGNQASALQDQLNRISSALTAGHCDAVRTATHGLAGAVASLPDTVNGNLRQALGSEVNQVAALSVQQCQPVTKTPTKPTTPTTPTTTTPTTPTTPTTTTPTTTTTTPTTPTTPTTQTTPATPPTTPGNSSGGGGLSGGAGSGSSGGSGGGNGNGQ